MSARKSIEERGARINWIWRTAAALSRDDGGKQLRSVLIQAVSNEYPAQRRTIDQWFDTLENQGKMKFNHESYEMLTWPSDIHPKQKKPEDS